MAVEFERVQVPADKLGESPIWDEAGQSLFWIDSVTRRIRRHRPASGETLSWEMPSQIGSIGLAQNQSLVVALQDGFYLFDLTTADLRPLALPEQGNAFVRFNDGRVDRHGRFLAGTMITEPQAPHDAKLYRLNPDNSVECFEKGLQLSNSLCFSPAGDRMYFSDSYRRQIWVYDYDGATGRVGERRVLAETGDTGSGTDGATVDAEGFIWMTLPQVGKIGRYSPAGKLERLLDVPPPHPSCVAFGGKNLDILYVTSIQDSGTGRLVSNHPESGKLVAIHGLGVKGLAEPRFAGQGR
jgi:sugar lactone lactonase YvrE